MGSVVIRAGARCALVIFAAIAAALAAAALAPPASAQVQIPISPGCEAAKAGQFNGLYGEQTALFGARGVSEEVTVSATEPHKGPLNNFPLELRIYYADGPSVVRADFPGVMRFTALVPVYVTWLATSGLPAPQQDAPVTWHVDCKQLLFNSPPPTPTSKKQCKHGGWKNYGSMFKNQGDCVSFVATGGKNPASGRLAPTSNSKISRRLLRRGL